MFEHLSDELLQSIIERYGIENISKLNLSKNNLKSISNIEVFAKTLKKLNVSKNKLGDLNAVRKLSELEDLNISENDIHDLAPLQGLPKLEELNITGNKISLLDQLKPLVNLKNLKVLHLIGNPICTNIEYPHELFNLLPYIERIDTWNKPKKENIISDGYTSSPPNSDANSSSYIINSLNLQIAALNNAFEIQEKLLANQGKIKSQEIVTHNQTILTPSHPHIDVSKEVDSFPYYQLLQSWRKKVVQLVMMKITNEKQLQSLIKQNKEERSRFIDEVQEKDMQCVKWKERLTAEEEKSSLLMKTLQSLEDQIQSLMTSKAFQDDKVHESQSGIRFIYEYLKKCKTAVDDNDVDKNVLLIQMLNKLDDYERRLHVATSKIQFATALNAQKEIQLRNTAAILEAERRVLQLEWVRNDLNETDSSMQKGKDSLQDVVDHASGPHQSHSVDVIERYLSDVNISPESEALLKSIFRNLDIMNSGTIEVQLLLCCVLLHESYGRFSNFDGKEDAEVAGVMDQPVAMDEDLREPILIPAFVHHKLLQQLLKLESIHLKEPEESEVNTSEWDFVDVKISKKSDEVGRGDGRNDWVTMLSPLGVFLGQSVGFETWRRFLKNMLLMPPDSSLTWGELLLQLVPEPGSRDWWCCQCQYPVSILPSSNRVARVSHHPEEESARPFEDSIVKLLNSKTRTVLSAKDIKGLNETKLLDTIDLGVLPLMIPSNVLRLGGKQQLKVMRTSQEFIQSMQSKPSGKGNTEYILSNHVVEASKKTSQSRPSNRSNDPTSLRRSYHQEDNLTRSLEIPNFNFNLKPHSEGVMNVNPYEVIQSMDKLIIEYDRVKNERDILMHQLQLTNRSIERRAEGIKAFFETDLKKSKLREDKLQHSVQEWKKKVEEIELRHTELDTVHNNYKQRMESRLAMLTEENEFMKEAIHRRKDETILKYEELLNESIHKFNRLETEHNLLQRDSSKKDIKCRALQRDLLRFQTSQSVQNNEIIRLNTELSDALSCNEKVRYDMSKQMEEMKLDWSMEKKDLLEKVNELQETMLKMNETMLDYRMKLEASVAPVTAPVGEKTVGLTAIIDHKLPVEMDTTSSVIAPTKSSRSEPKLVSFHGSKMDPPLPQLDPIKINPLKLPQNATNALSSQLDRLLRIAENLTN